MRFLPGWNRAVSEKFGGLRQARANAVGDHLDLSTLIQLPPTPTMTTGMLPLDRFMFLANSVQLTDRPSIPYDPQAHSPNSRRKTNGHRRKGKRLSEAQPTTSDSFQHTHT